jgi:poly(hydroxyalkanoate) depolymerase family esterase
MPKLKYMYKYLSIALLAVVAMSRCEKPTGPTGMTEMTAFGSNPGELKCWQYVPEGNLRKVPLVVVLHGCLQDAQEMARLSGWNTLADQEKFIVLYPQQSAANNLNRCFNWYQPADVSRNNGEAASISQMIAHALTQHNIDDTRIFVTGVSAGGAMSLVLAAAYPETIKAAAPIAGIPYSAADNLSTGLAAMAGNVTLSPEAWGQKVKSQNASFSGTYPRVAIFHGVDDNIVKMANAGEIAKQWSYLHGLVNDAGVATENFNNNPKVKRTLWSKAGKEVVVRYDLSGLGHAIPVDPGTAPHQGGETATFAKDLDFHAAWWSAVFFGIAR